MSFEKDFQGLWVKGVQEVNESQSLVDGSMVEFVGYSCEDISKFCLDKVKVKEAFKRYATIWAYERVKKELGL